MSACSRPSENSSSAFLARRTLMKRDSTDMRSAINLRTMARMRHACCVFALRPVIVLYNVRQHMIQKLEEVPLSFFFLCNIHHTL